ncbi:MAG: hypothetical protein GY820_18995 [Gammaproteobacteria bacterium]|nr:hypothetical protein [Gammaproteobacteria bacterium]
MLKSMQELVALKEDSPGSKQIHAPNIVEWRYGRRTERVGGKALSRLCLAEYATHYDLRKRDNVDKVDVDKDFNEDDFEEDQDENDALLGQFGFGFTEVVLNCHCGIHLLSKLGNYGLNLKFVITVSFLGFS